MIFRSDEELTLETTALWSIYGGHFILLTLFDKKNYFQLGIVSRGSEQFSYVK